MKLRWVGAVTLLSAALIVPMTGVTFGGDGEDPDATTTAPAARTIATTTVAPTTTAAATTLAPTTTAAATTTAPTTTVVNTNPNTAPTTSQPSIKVFVCKFVGTPGVDEVLQTGQNPISVSVNSIPGWSGTIGEFFADAQGRSLVIAFDTGQPEPDPSECVPNGGSTTTTIVPPPPPPGSTTTTTTTSSTTTTTEASGFTYQFLGPICVGDFPFISYELDLQGQPPPADGVTITVTDINGVVVLELTGQPLSGSFIWPGASVDPPDWPGWLLNEAGVWEEDPSDEVLREGLTITAFFNPTAEGFVEYPPSTAACASPDGPFPPGSTTTTVTPGVPGVTTVPPPPPPGAPSAPLPPTL